MRLESLTDLRRPAPAVPAGANGSEIAGCSSRVEFCRDNNRFYVTADSAIVRGIAAILAAMVDGKTASEIRDMDLAAEFASLQLNLGASRLNGVNSMISFLQNL